ncbi:MAG: hypothetical protein K2M41_07435 [Muribaculaceae bacterium]|nr:hypothetical protein [Muribaculaceae bacterium]
MEEQYRKEITRWFAELGLENEVDNYLSSFPELNSRLAKFAIGILKWNLAGLININNPDDVSRVRLILKVIGQTPGYDFFDNTFNECEPETVCEILGMSPTAPLEEPEIKFNYTVNRIGNYADARQYHDMTSWCIVISEESFNAYTAYGNRFYFCGNGEWWDVPCIPGNGFPRDRFGYSLIAVEVSPENKIVSITSRWNTCRGDTGDFITKDELKSVLGMENYNKLLCKPAENH